MRSQTTADAPLLLYDFLSVYGGAERVLAIMQAHWDSDVCVGFSRAESFGRQIPANRLIDLRADHSLQPLKIAKLLRAFSTRGEQAASRYSLRLYAGSYSVLAHRPEHPGTSLYYCHTPPRFLYDLRDHYVHASPQWQRPLLATLRAWLQPRYETAVKGMHTVWANSRNVQQRLKTHVGVESQVVYPPVDTDRFKWIADGNYFLSTSRLEPLKRVDVLVEAFKAMPQHTLVITSGGSEFERLKRMAADSTNIRFTGWTSDEQLRRLMGEARATLYAPKDEDFGMSPVESMAAGKPVIGVAEGGVLETVLHGETGILIQQATPEAVRDAVTELSSTRSLNMRTACEDRATMFSRARFFSTIDSALNAINIKP